MKTNACCYSGLVHRVSGSLSPEVCGGGELPADAARREVLEETGLTEGLLVDAGYAERFPILPSWRHRYAPDVRVNIEHVFFWKLEEKAVIRLSSSEHAGYEWLPLNQAILRVDSWTNRQALQLLETERSMSKETVVLLHGLWMHGTAMTLLMRHLSEEGFEPLAFSYRTVAEDLESNANALAEFIEPLARPCHLVGHSLGAWSCSLCSESTVPLRLFAVCAWVRRWPRAPLRVRWETGLGAAFYWAEAMTRWPIVPQWFHHPVPDWDDCRGCARRLGPVDCPVRRPLNDGTVSVEETKVEGLADHVVLKVSHLAMLWSDQVGIRSCRSLRPAVSPVKSPGCRRAFRQRSGLGSWCRRAFRPDRGSESRLKPLPQSRSYEPLPPLC